MAYNGFPVGYQPTYYPTVQQQPMAVQNNGLVWVQGEAGAKSYIIPANGTVLLMDSETDQFFLKSTDASGMPMPLRTFKYTEVTGENGRRNASVAKDEEIYVTKSEMAQFKREVLQMLKKDEVVEYEQQHL